MAAHKTNEYHKFVFRDDNREKINQAHVRRLISSIKCRNLLEYQPILVTKDFEIIDGQHRLLAAKELGLDIYYQVDTKNQPIDVILLNTSKTWGVKDYLNYYVKHGFEEYIKLNNFIIKNNLSIKIVINLMYGQNRDIYENYRLGKFVFKQDIYQGEMECAWNSIEIIKKHHGYSVFLYTSKFWKAIIQIVKNEDFDSQKWYSNLERMIERIGPRVSYNDYLKMLGDIYNWRNSVPLTFDI